MAIGPRMPRMSLVTPRFRRVVRRGGTLAPPGPSPVDLIALTSDDGTEMLVSDENEALVVTQEAIDIVEGLWS